MSAEIFGYTFKDPALLDRALSSPSCRNRSDFKGDNQRLEFLGDAVLSFLASRQVYAQLENAGEGELTIRRSRMVSTAALCAAAARLAFVDLIKVGKGMPRPSANSKCVADAMEAVIGAAYEDGGLAAAEIVYATMDLFASSEASEEFSDPKTGLQHFAQALPGHLSPRYCVLKTTGTANNPVFTVEVEVAGFGCETATGHSKQEAEVRAAAALLARVRRKKRE